MRTLSGGKLGRIDCDRRLGRWRRQIGRVSGEGLRQDIDGEFVGRRRGVQPGRIGQREAKGAPVAIHPHIADIAWKRARDGLGVHAYLAAEIEGQHTVGERGFGLGGGGEREEDAGIAAIGLGGDGIGLRQGHGKEDARNQCGASKPAPFASRHDGFTVARFARLRLQLRVSRPVSPARCLWVPPRPGAPSQLVARVRPMAAAR